MDEIDIIEIVLSKLLHSFPLRLLIIDLFTSFLFTYFSQIIVQNI